MTPFFNSIKFSQRIVAGCATAILLSASCPSANAISFPFFKKKEKAKTEQATPPPSAYKQLTGRDSVSMEGVMNVIHKGDTVYMELPANLLGRQFLVTNKLQQVPLELNEAGVNKGINYENQTIRFEWNKQAKKLIIRQQRLTPESPEGSAISRSVKDNYIDPIIAAIKIEQMPKDSSTFIIKVNDLFDGKKNCLNDVFNNINIGTSPNSELSRILSVKSYENSVVATSELTTTVHEGTGKVNVTVVVSTAITLLPEREMSRREEDWRVGYFTTSLLHYDDMQQQVKRTNYITRWRLEPKDSAAYMRGELVEPIKPIVFYIDPATPEHLRPYMKKGITDWNRVFEKAGFKNAVQALEYSDTLANSGDDMHFSVLTYDASTKANAMGPSVIDPRSGEILEADIIWWHNVQVVIKEWITVQTGAVDPRARAMKLPTDLIGDAVRFVACHEVGHSLGLRHNMMASAAYPTDSLRSKTFTDRVGGTAASIMDYARFNYIAQPEDGVTKLSPQIGPYDEMAIEWGYRWYPAGTDEKRVLNDFLLRHKGKEYRYSESQSRRTAIDPRALSEDLGDDAVKSATYGVANLKRILPNIIEWSRTGEPGQTLDEAAELYAAVVGQWSLYHYHVMANIGGMYIDRPLIDDPQPAYIFVEKEKQRAALQWLLDEVLCMPKWLFDNEISERVYLQRHTPYGTEEQKPALILRNQQNYIFWDLLENQRIQRMYENEMHNGDKAFKAVDFMDMIHRHIFKTTIAGKSPNMMERSLQKSFVDALITAANENEGVKINKSLADNGLSSGSRSVEFTNRQISRNSDALSLKRAELIRVQKLLKSKRNQGTLEAQMHYEDILLRIKTALGE